MILKAILILEIAAAGVIGGWLFLFNKPAEPPQVTPVTPIVTPYEAPLAEQPQPTSQTSPAPTQTIFVPIPTPIQQVDPQIIATTTEPTPETIPTPAPTPQPTPPPQTVYIPIYITQPAPASQPAPELLPTETQPIMTTTIEIINPIAGKGLGRTYTAQPQVVDETNYIELGLIVRENGEPVKNAVVTITATDETQNKTLNGTGNVYPRYENEVRILTPFYPFHYELKTAGDHTITFSVPGADPQSVTLTVTEPDPA